MATVRRTMALRSAWMRALEREDLIDIDEWCALRGIESSLPRGAAMTRRVCDAIEVGLSTSPRHAWVTCAKAMLKQASAALTRSPRHAGARFGAELPKPRGGGAWAILVLHCLRCADAESLYCISLDGERPLLGCCERSTARGCSSPGRGRQSPEAMKLAQS